MKTVYVVKNPDAIVLAVFDKRKTANDFIKNVGMKLWKEQWYVHAHKLNEIKKWLMEDYDQ